MDSVLGFRGFNGYQYENNEAEQHLKRAPDYVRPDSDAKYIKRHELDMPKNAVNVVTSEINNDIFNTVLGSMLLNACKAKNEVAADNIFRNIKSHVGLIIIDQAGNTVLKYASPILREQILKELGNFNSVAEKSDDLEVIEDIENALDLNELQELEKYCR